ncbi:MAG: hypothetical protein COB02_03440 [Candidatus Cloacimonadota bacterium]|nr:MAG: hypothetical protein COB02_03440 [Candidatus Cloacimonadota bacterium]
MSLIQDLYKDYSETGEFSWQKLWNDSSDLYFHKLQGQILKYKGDFEGSFVVCLLEYTQPIRLKQMILFVEKDGVIETCENPVKFLENLVLDVSIKENFDDAYFFSKFKKPLGSWINFQVESREAELKVRLDDDIERLNMYFKDTYQELDQKRRAVYFHNYYFEKEQQIKVEMERMESELKAQKALLLAKYQAIWKLDCLIKGIIKK